MFGNGIVQTSTTTGTGDLTLSSVSGFPAFNDVFGTNRYFAYAILNDSDGSPIEWGIGYLSASTTLVRSKVVCTYASGTYDDTAPSAVSLAAGTKRVICAAEAAMLGAAVTDIADLSGTADLRAFGPTHMTGANTSTAIVKDRLIYVPVQFTGTGAVESIRFCNGGTAGAGGTRGFRVGLYDCLPTGGPGKKLYESGDIASSAFANLTLTLGTPVRLPPGWYYAAVVHDYATTAPNVYGSANSSGASAGLSPLGWDKGNGFQYRNIACYEALGAGWSSLPANASASTSLTALRTDQGAPYPLIVLN